MENPFFAVVALALLTEVSVDVVKTLFPAVRNWRSQAASVVMGISLALLTETGMLTVLGIDIPWFWLDYVLTGLAISRGSNFIHDFLSRF